MKLITLLTGVLCCLFLSQWLSKGCFKESIAFRGRASQRSRLVFPSTSASAPSLFGRKTDDCSVFCRLSPHRDSLFSGYYFISSPWRAFHSQQQKNTNLKCAIDFCAVNSNKKQNICEDSFRKIAGGVSCTLREKWWAETGLLQETTGLEWTEGPKRHQESFSWKSRSN